MKTFSDMNKGFQGERLQNCVCGGEVPIYNLIKCWTSVFSQQKGLQRQGKINIHAQSVARDTSKQQVESDI